MFLTHAHPKKSQFPNLSINGDVNTGPATGDCNFEQGSCHWNNTAVSDMPWYLRKGATGSKSTGPDIDHTTGTSSGRAYIAFVM